MKWINFIHIYQPANTEAHIIKEAADKSYIRIVKALEENPKIKFTMNVTGCLYLRLEELGYGELIKRIVKLKEKGQLELTGTAAYHPLLPLIKKEESIRQIKENEEIKKKYFGENYHDKGFFFPEMAYSKEVAKAVKKMGYEWIILDEISHSGVIGKIDTNKVYLDKNSGLKVVFRQRKLSNSYVPDGLLLKGRADKSQYITATDGELYGLRHEDPTGAFEKLLSKEYLETQTVSEFINEQKKFDSIKVVSSHWNATEDELARNVHYSLWYEKDNKIQMDLWKLADLAYKAVEGNKHDVNYKYARWHLVRGLASCSFWWASAKDFRVFGPISWSPDEIERGANELSRAVRSLANIDTQKVKLKAEKLSSKIKLQTWTKHWEKYWKA